MANLLKRIKNLWAWSETTPQDLYDIINPTPETVARWKKITEPFVVKGNGNGAVLPLMSEEEMNVHLKENDLGWKKIYDQVRNLGKQNDDGDIR